MAGNLRAIALLCAFLTFYPVTKSMELLDGRLNEENSISLSEEEATPYMHCGLYVAFHEIQPTTVVSGFRLRGGALLLRITRNPMVAFETAMSSEGDGDAAHWTKEAEHVEEEWDSSGLADPLSLQQAALLQGIQEARMQFLGKLLEAEESQGFRSAEASEEGTLGWTHPEQGIRYGNQGVEEMVAVDPQEYDMSEPETGMWETVRFYMWDNMGPVSIPLAFNCLLLVALLVLLLLPFRRTDNLDKRILVVNTPDAKKPLLQTYVVSYDLREGATPKVDESVKEMGDVVPYIPPNAV